MTEQAEDSLAELFRANYSRLVRALTLAYGPEIAAEAVQEAFVQAHLHWHRIDRYTEPAAWVRRVAVNRARTQRRNLRRRDLHPARFVRPVPVESLSDELADLRRGIDALPERMRLVFSLHYLAGLTMEEIAAALEISPGTVKSTLFDARRKLRADWTDGFSTTMVAVPTQTEQPVAPVPPFVQTDMDDR